MWWSWCGFEPTNSLLLCECSCHLSRKTILEYCIAHNPLLLQLLGHWFTFIYRKCEHLAVEDFIVKVLCDSRGSRRFTFALLPSLYLYYSTLLAICQVLFLFFFAGGATRTHIIPLPTQPTTPATDGRTRLERVEWHTGGLSATDAHHLRFVPLLYHNWGDLSSLIFCREDT